MPATLLLALVAATTVALAQECSARCGSWHFPPHQDTSIFQLHPLTLPAAWSIEAWIKRPGPSQSGHWMFSLATPLTDNCVLLSAAALPDSEWHHVVVTSESKTYLDGVDKSSTNLQDRNNGAGCSQSGSAFVMNVDQDAVASRLDPSQASNLYVNSVAIYDAALSVSTAATRFQYGCTTTGGAGSEHRWAMWLGDDASPTPRDQTGNNHATASLTLTADGATSFGPQCPMPPPAMPPPPASPSPPPLRPSPPSPPRFCAAQCTSWRFPRSQISYRFQITPLKLPAAFTIEAWLRHVGDPQRTAQGTYFFSLATPAQYNCILLHAGVLPDEAWHHVAVTSNGDIFLDGVSTPGLGSNHGAECANVENSGFLVNNDQDRVASRLDDHQAANLVVNAVSIFSSAFTPQRALSRAGRGCASLVEDPINSPTERPADLWGAWFADDDEDDDDDDRRRQLHGDLGEGADRTGLNNAEAMVALPWPGGVPAEGPGCGRAAARAAAEARTDGHGGGGGDGGGGGGGGGSTFFSVMAFLLSLGTFGLVAHGRGWFARFGFGAAPRARTSSVLTVTNTAAPMNLSLASNDYSSQPLGVPGQSTA